mmetsp:Transcript_38908/g.93599  ORF Transcript_38908/g.93599 Transcript_38908/m.93599 type:complete len:168 (+) Transcript_38908:555-1058(+)
MICPPPLHLEIATWAMTRMAQALPIAMMGIVSRALNDVEARDVLRLSACLEEHVTDLFEWRSFDHDDDDAHDDDDGDGGEGGTTSCTSRDSSSSYSRGWPPSCEGCCTWFGRRHGGASTAGRSSRSITTSWTAMTPYILRREEGRMTTTKQRGTAGAGIPRDGGQIH